MEISLSPSTGSSAGDLIKDSATATFQQDVIDESNNQPVLVDFWAPWCGPCKQLGPAIEKVVTENGGKVKLVKINVDENQALAGKMGVQSIPVVFAFSGGKPIDGFQGALPESEIRKFVQKQLDSAGAPPDSPEAQIKEALKGAEQALDAGDLQTADQIYQSILQYQPDNDEALIGLARVLTLSKKEDDAETVLAQVSQDGRTLDSYKAVESALQLAREAQGLGDTAELEGKVAADPEDHQARYDLAIALNAKDDRIGAAENLITILRKDRDWNEDGARKKLLELFDAWGPTDPATLKARRLLSAALFA